MTAGHLPSKQVSDLINQCESVIPDSDEFSSIFTGAASNAAAAVIYTLQSCLDGDPKRVALVGRLAIDTINEYLYVVNAPDIEPHAHDPAFDQWIQQAPLMMAELQKQQIDLKTLKSEARLDSCFLDKWRQEASQVGIFPYKRGLVPFQLPQKESYRTPALVHARAQLSCRLPRNLAPRQEIPRQST